MKTALRIAGFLSVLLITEISTAQLNQGKPAILENIGIEEKLGEQIPLDVTFANSEGDSVTIGDLLEEGKPVLLNPLYYECPMLCGLVLEGVFKVVNELQWNPGEDYIIISFSIDPDETSEHAARSKEKYVNKLDRKGAESGWHLLTGNENNILKLTEAIGFKYTYDERTGEYVHAAAISFLSTDGKIRSAVDRVVLYCFTYDPSSDSYVPVALNIMKLGGLATLIFLGIFLGLFWMREKKSSQTQTF